MMGQTADHIVVLSRDERECLRHELSLLATIPGNLGRLIARGDHAAAHRELQDLIAIVRLMDAVGWREPADGPDERVIGADSRLATWATDIVESFARSFGLGELNDTERRAISALRRIAGEV